MQKIALSVIEKAPPMKLNDQLKQINYPKPAMKADWLMKIEL